MENHWENGREELLKEIEQWMFAAIEWTLFLDTHPESKEALREYNQAAEKHMMLAREYERRYGPLQPYGMSTSDYPWQWVEEPWPWQRGI